MQTHGPKFPGERDPSTGRHGFGGMRTPAIRLFQNARIVTLAALAVDDWAAHGGIPAKALAAATRCRQGPEDERIEAARAGRHVARIERRRAVSSVPRILPAIA